MVLWRGSTDIEIRNQPNGALILTQSMYIRDLLTKTKMNEVNPVSSRMVGGCKLTKSVYESFFDPTLYRSVVAALQYATIIRPEISSHSHTVHVYQGLVDKD